MITMRYSAFTFNIQKELLQFIYQTKYLWQLPFWLSWTHCKSTLWWHMISSTTKYSTNVMTEPTGGTDRGRENGKWRDIFRYKDILHNTKPLPGSHFHDRRAWYTVCVSLGNLQSWPFFHCLWDCKDCLPHDMLHLQMIAK